MKTLPALRAGVLVFACTLATTTQATTASAAQDTLTGDVALACDAILCLSSSVQPGECSPSLSRYFGIEVFKHGVLSWSRTVAARRSFLAMCPVVESPGMSERVDAISQGAGKCDENYLNSTYAGTVYKYRVRGHLINGMTLYEVHEIPTVTLNKLPSYCVAYNNDELTYLLSIRYVGTPLMGGRWVKAEKYDTAQAKWNARHGGNWGKGWTFSFTDPRDQKPNRNDDNGIGNNRR